MSVVWDKLFGNGKLPSANDSPPLVVSSDNVSTALVDFASDRVSGGKGSIVDPLPNSVAVARTFDSIGRRNEALRSKLDMIEFGFRNIESIKVSFREILQPIDEVLSEIERSKTAHHEAESKFEALSDAHTRLKKEQAALTIERDVLSVKHDELAVRTRFLEQSQRNSETALAETRAVLAEKNARVDRLERELEDTRRRIAVVTEQVPTLRAEFAAKVKCLQEVEELRATLQDQHNILAEENRSQRSQIEELVANLSKLNRQLGELENRYADANRRVGELDAALKHEVSNHAKLRTAQLDDADSHRANLAALQSELNSMNARSEAAERLLSDARSDLGARNAAIRELEQQVLESSLAVQTRDRSQADLEKDVAALRRQLGEMDEARTAVSERSIELAKDLESKGAALQGAERKIEALEARVAELGRVAAAEREQRDQTIDKLREKLDAETSARAFAEGALHSARHERAAWQKDTEGAPEPASAAAEPSREKVTRLRG